jgi:hypothetical protein
MVFAGTTRLLHRSFVERPQAADGDQLLWHFELRLFGGAEDGSTADWPHCAGQLRSLLCVRSSATPTSSQSSLCVCCNPFLLRVSFLCDVTSSLWQSYLRFSQSSKRSMRKSSQCLDSYLKCVESYIKRPKSSHTWFSVLVLGCARSFCRLWVAA